MNIKIIILFTIVALVLELVELQAIHKYLRPRKFYRPKHQWRAFLRSQKYRLMKGPPKHRTKWHSSSSYSRHHSAEEEPYTIEIELPKGQEPNYHDYTPKSSKRFYQSHLNHEVNGDMRIINFGKKKVGIELIKDVRPKLRIKISRDDHFPELSDETNFKNYKNHENNSFVTNQLSKSSNHERQLLIDNLRGL